MKRSSYYRRPASFGNDPASTAPTFACRTVATFAGTVFYNFGPYALELVSITSPKTGRTVTARADALPPKMLSKIQNRMFFVGEQVTEEDASGIYDNDPTALKAAYASISDLTVYYTADELRAFVAASRKVA